MCFRRQVPQGRAVPARLPTDPMAHRQSARGLQGRSDSLNSPDLPEKRKDLTRWAALSQGTAELKEEGNETSRSGIGGRGRSNIVSKRFENSRLAARIVDAELQVSHQRTLVEQMKGGSYPTMGEEYVLEQMLNSLRRLYRSRRLLHDAPEPEPEPR